MIDLEAICDALALRFEPGTIGTPSGGPAMREVYSESPRSVPTVPAVLLEVQDGTLVASPGQWKHEISIDVLFLLSKRPADPVRVETNRRKWLPYLLQATVGQMKLGLGGASGYSVDKAIPISWEFTEFDVADVTFDAIRVRYVAYVTESVTLTP
ncbi:MAG TPA: hypothetical protein VMW94_02980 [Actinomycetes bacterium]|nr:hypothetical protein [Actinomycetes bacterium]